MNDPVNHPAHYKAYEGLEIIDLTEQMNFNRGNAVKYIARAGFKNPEHEIQDLEKAVWYIQREIQRLSKPKQMCLTCGDTKSNSDAIFCGGCGNCLSHCACNAWVDQPTCDECGNTKYAIFCDGCGNCVIHCVCKVGIDGWGDPDVQPTCAECGKHSGITVWCGSCGCCLEHCQHYSGCMYGPKLDPEPAGFISNITFEESGGTPEGYVCPHWMEPSQEHLYGSCAPYRQMMQFDVKNFDTGDAHFVANHTVHMNMDDAADIVIAAKERGTVVVEFLLSTHEVSPPAKKAKRHG